jgi:hypothetical protein
MDGNGFDELTRRLATQRSRRSVLRGLVGGGAALAATRAGASLAAPKGKAEICHLGDDGLFHLISVAQSALPAHEAHGDGTLYVGTNDHCSACGDACTGYDACGGGEVAGQCGCTPTFTAENCDGVTCGEIEDGCGFYVTCGCGDGYVCGAEGCEPAPTGCSNAVLTGAQASGLVCVDDALLVRVNGNEVFYQPSIFCQPEVPLGSLANGDTVSLEIYDYFPPCSIEPYQLVCLDTGAVQVLNANGFCAGLNDCDVGEEWTGFGLCHNPSHIVNFGA